MEKLFNDQLIRNNEILSFYNVNYNLRNSIEHGFLDLNVDVFLRNNLALLIWLEGIYFISNYFNERKSFIDPLYKETEKKYSFLIQGKYNPSLETSSSVKCEKDENERIIKVFYEVSNFIEINIQKEFLQLFRNNLKLSEIIRISEDIIFPKVELNNENKNLLVTNIKAILSTVQDEIPNAGIEQYFSKNIMTTALLFVYPSKAVCEKCFSASVSPSIIIKGKEITSGGNVILWEKNPLDKELSFYKHLYKSHFLAGTYTAKDLIYQINRHSLKSSISAIMSRNMSHNIGSHVIADMVSKGVNAGEGDLNSFFRYLQNRMDFIAQITTDFPEWSYPAYFNKELMRIFYESYILIDRIGVSEGLGAYQWPKNWGEGDMRSKIIARTCTTQWENGKVKKDTVDWGINEYHMGDLCNDLQLAIPGGIVGYHAFYIILENIIRNSAKHDYASRMKERLNLNNDIIDELIFIKFENIKECSFWIVFKDDANKRIKDKTDIEKKIKTCRALIIESTCLTVEKDSNSSKYDFICGKDKDNVEIKLIDDKVPSLIIPRGDRFFIACIANSHTDNCHFNIKKENSEICLVVDKDYWQEKKPYYQVLTEKEYNQLKDKYGLVKNEIPPGTGSPGDIEAEHSFWKKRYDSIINFLQSGPLRINIRIDDMVDKDYVWVTIWDNMRHKPIPFDKNNDVNNEVSGNISEDEMKKRVLSIPSVNLFGYMNDRLRQSFIEETGELKRENWGLGELKICAGFLQNRKIEEIGASGQEIIQYGKDCFKLDSKFVIDDTDNPNQGYPRMLIKALPVDKKGQLFDTERGGKLEKEDFYFLGFRFWMKKPKTVALHGFECKGKKE